MKRLLAIVGLALLAAGSASAQSYPEDAVLLKNNGADGCFEHVRFYDLSWNKVVPPCPTYCTDAENGLYNLVMGWVKVVTVYAPGCHAVFGGRRYVMQVLSNTMPGNIKWHYTISNEVNPPYNTCTGSN